MGTVVIDAGIPIGLILRLPWSEAAEQAMVTWRREDISLAAPALWLYEAVTVLRRAVVNHILDKEIGLEWLRQVQLLGIQAVPPDTELLLSSLRWAERLGQSKAYDAQYVALAEQLSAELWSADRRLVNVLNAQGVSWAHWIGEG